MASIFFKSHAVLKKVLPFFVSFSLQNCLDNLKHYVGFDFANLLVNHSDIPKFFYHGNVLYQIKTERHQIKTERRDIHIDFGSSTTSFEVLPIQNTDKKQALAVRAFNEVTTGGRCNTEINILVGTQDQFKLNPGEVFINSSIMPYDINGKQPWIFNDPIAFVPVRNGLLAKSMWGEEAKLPEFFDSSQN